MTALPQSDLGKTGLRVSRLGLGTAEIGFAYGLGPTALPQETEAFELLNEARALGVTFFDTANYYGLAEERLGKSGILNAAGTVVCTKCAQFLEKGEDLSAAQMEETIREQVSGSLKSLNLSALPILLLHGPSAAQMQEGNLPAIMEKLRAEGLVRFWGASTRGEEAALAAMQAGAEIIQVAFNIADQRMSAKVFPEAIARGVGIIQRSAYLKGVFAGRAEYLPPGLDALQGVVKRAQEISKSLGITLPELALRFSLSEPAIAATLVGTANPEHLRDAANAVLKGPLPDAAVGDLRSLAVSDPDQVDPARWQKI